MTDKAKFARFDEVDKEWKEINNHPFYELAQFYEHKLAWDKNTIPKEVFMWLIENCSNKFSEDLVEYTIYFSFINKDDAIHFRMVWL